MVVCRYFQQGNCRFGANCKYEHPGSQYGSPVPAVSPLLRSNQQHTASIISSQHAASNPFRGPSGGGPVGHAGGVPNDLRDVFTALQQELEIWDRSGMWPLSCFNPLPARTFGVVPGLEDHSPEELRFLLYEARLAGNLHPCTQQIQQLYQQARAHRGALKTPNSETVAILENMLRNRSTAQQFSFAGSVAQDAWPSTGSASNPVFGGAASNTKSIFGGASSPSGFGGSVGQPLFGGSQSVVGQESAFGVPSQTTIQQISVFGSNVPTASPLQNSVFGGNAGQQSAFGPSQTQGQQPSHFGGTAVYAGTTDNSNFFGASAAFSANSQPGSIFGGNSQQAGSALVNAGAGSVESSAASKFTFSLAAPFTQGNNAPFVQGQVGNGQSVFGGSLMQAQPGFPIGPGPASQTSQATGITQSGASAPAGLVSTGSVDPSVYSALSDITKEEEREFAAPTFTHGRIPTRPPPKELCL